MLRGVFVTGTDTGIGKTVVSAVVMSHLRALLAGEGRRTRLRYWKPIQTGIEADDDTETVARLASCGADEILTIGVRLPRPLSPHLSARLAGRVIRIDDLMAIAANAPPADLWVIEGAGGLLVPINETDLVADLIVGLNLPVIITARSALGTINHTLLTLEALATRGLRVVGVAMVGTPNDVNREAIEAYGRVPVLGQVPLWSPLVPDALQRWATEEFDPDRRLVEILDR